MEPRSGQRVLIKIQEDFRNPFVAQVSTDAFR